MNKKIDLAQATLLRNKKLSKDNTGKITISLDFLGLVTKMLQEHPALFACSNLQMKQWFLINLHAT